MQVAVVGAAGGIGRALVARLLADGAEVVAIDLPVSLERHPPPAGVATIDIDLTDPASVTAAATRLAQLAPALTGCVVCSGFMSEPGPLLQTSDETFDTVLLGNLSGTVRWARAVIPLLLRQPSSSLVHVASGLAHFIRPGYGPYSAAKAGLIAITKTLGPRMRPPLARQRGCPGCDRHRLPGRRHRPQRRERSRYHRPQRLRRQPSPEALGEPDDVVGPMMFLLGNDSRYMTGQVLWVNGGGYLP